ncbi:MAG: hypothetical protein WCT42_03335 [Candidatus Paceibacterota bacterium]
MENSFQTSFIPKKPITSIVSDKEPKSFFSMISIFILVASLVLLASLFIYKNYLTKQKETASASLLIVRDSFEESTIEELDSFNKKTDAAKQVLNKHIVLSPMFTLLGDITISQVQYTKFEQKNENGLFSVNIEGLARDYRSIALQADIFNSSKGSSFKNVVFSKLTKDKNGNISFNLEFDVDANLLSYEKNSLLAPQVSNNPVLPDNSPLQNLENKTQ